MPTELEAVLVIPHRPVRTAAAREALPAAVPMADAVAQPRADRQARQPDWPPSDWELIAGGLGDRLHQPYRAHLYPRSAEIVARAPRITARSERPSPEPGRRCWSGAVADARRRAELDAVARRGRGRLGRGQGRAVRAAAARPSRRSERRSALGAPVSLLARVLEPEALEQFARRRRGSRPPGRGGSRGSRAPARPTRRRRSTGGSSCRAACRR